MNVIDLVLGMELRLTQPPTLFGASLTTLNLILFYETEIQGVSKKTQ